MRKYPAAYDSPSEGAVKGREPEIASPRFSASKNGAIPTAADRPARFPGQARRRRTRERDAMARGGRNAQELRYLRRIREVRGSALLLDHDWQVADERTEPVVGFPTITAVGRNRAAKCAVQKKLLLAKFHTAANHVSIVTGAGQGAFSFRKLRSFPQGTGRIELVPAASLSASI